MLYLVIGAIAAYAAYQCFFADDRDDSPPSRSQSRSESSQPQVRRRDERQYQSNSFQRDYTPVEVLRRDERQYQSNSSQRDYTPVEAYSSLRARAKQEGDLMSQCYKQSQEAYQTGDRARAKALSEEGKRHALKMDNLNAQASATIFQENNQNKPACEIDLHGLYVKEAITYSENAIREARLRGDSKIHLIVGQGTHSDGGVPRLKPAIQEDLQMRPGVHVEVHSTNPGMLVVHLGSR